MVTTLPAGSTSAFTFNPNTCLFDISIPQGANSLVNSSTEPAGANCPNGGTKFDSGVDDDGDNTLDSGEIDATSYACSGSDSLITTTSEASGMNCPSGGRKIQVGVDDDGDNTLDAGEVDSTSYACNGSKVYSHQQVKPLE